MYISQINCKTQGLRKAFINSMTNDRHYNIKSLKKLDKDLAKTYTNTKYYGGSLGSFWKKVKNFGKKVLNAPAKIASKIYPWMKKGIDALDKNDTAKKLLEKIPIVGPAIPAAIHGLKDVTDNVDVLIKNIQEKNPGASLQQIKEIIRKIKGTFDDVKDKIPEEDKQIIKNNVDKVLKHLPTIIQKEGVTKVDKAAGYLPYLDKSTMKIEERTSKTGGALKPKIRFNKPSLITKYKDIFSKLPAYDAKVIGEVGGALYYKTISKNPNSKETKHGLGHNLPFSNKSKLDGLSESERSEFMKYYKDKNKERAEKHKGDTNKWVANTFDYDLNEWKKMKGKSGEVTTPSTNVGCGRIDLSGRTKLAGESEREQILARLRGKK